MKLTKIFGHYWILFIIVIAAAFWYDLIQLESKP